MYLSISEPMNLTRLCPAHAVMLFLFQSDSWLMSLLLNGTAYGQWTLYQTINAMFLDLDPGLQLTCERFPCSLNVTHGCAPLVDVPPATVTPKATNDASLMGVFIASMVAFIIAALLFGVVWMRQRKTLQSPPVAGGSHVDPYSSDPDHDDDDHDVHVYLDEVPMDTIPL